jgi:SAM-dependent methyltransferase
MGNPDSTDHSRLRAEYADRARRFAGSDVYSPFNRANLFAVQGRQRAFLHALRQHEVTDLRQTRILEMGCGDGGVLAEFLTFGASPQNLFGIDLLPDRLSAAKNKLPGSPLVNADGSRLPFPDSSFDLILQFTALSSILDLSLRRDIARDMLRLLRPTGLILSYDFWLNPTNRQTHGLRPVEIRELFPNCQIAFQRITLAPPLARALIPISWGLCYFLESLTIFNTHYLASIHPMN